ncbi:MAG: M28 family peptidase [Eubacteriales bacterium]|nr:M28 family peptidase [Eubacteriales bacterium]MDD4323828.1 M28 family peptidase [Eubacteriales bacterium]MDD4540787.1 M28 family peptidase [Eubacteriales bacterium]
MSLDKPLPLNKAGSIIRYTCFVLALILLALPLFACQTDEPEAKTRDAAYGTAGAEFAETLAHNFSRRTPGSDEEAGAAQFIFDQLKLMGYSPQKQDFSFYKTGVPTESQNIIAKINGEGFSYSPQFEQDRSESAAAKIDDRILIIGAHYDTPEFTPEADENGYVPSNTADGIHNNASGVAAVLMAAKQMLQVKPGYDIYFVFFGSGTYKQEGAKAYLKSLSDSEINLIDAMVNIGPIYAGDKIYAHAGQNSVLPGAEKDYEMRRKLYQVTDVFFDYMLNTQNSYAVYTNQSDYFMPYSPLGGGATQLGLYREWTVIESDHTPFDRAGIPIVFIESGDYNVTKEDLGQENTSPRFAPTNGMISGSLFDESDYLEEFFRTLEEEDTVIEWPAVTESDATNTETNGTEKEEPADTRAYDDNRLTKRINNTAFILVQLARRGPIDYVYDQ